MWFDLACFGWAGGGVHWTPVLSCKTVLALKAFTCLFLSRGCWSELCYSKFNRDRKWKMEYVYGKEVGDSLSQCKYKKKNNTHTKKK